MTEPTMPAPSTVEADPEPRHPRRRPLLIAGLVVAVVIGVGIVADLAIGTPQHRTTYNAAGVSATPPQGWQPDKPQAGFDLALAGPEGEILAVKEEANADHLTAAKLKAAIEAGTILPGIPSSTPPVIVSTSAGPGVQVTRQAAGFTVTLLRIPTTHHIWSVLQGPGPDSKAAGSMRDAVASLKLTP